MTTVTTTVDSILDGTMDVEGMNFPPHVVEWLKWLQMTPEEKNLNQNEPRVMAEQFAEAFKVQDELTSSHPHPACIIRPGKR